MKRSLPLLLLALLLWATNSYAQDNDPPLHGDILAELRETYSTLDANRIKTGVLFDQIVPLSKPERFAGQGDTSTNWMGWEQQYHEFYNATLTQTTLATQEKIRDNIRARVAEGAIPLLMLYYNYNKLRPDAADKNLITVDSANSRVYDGPEMSNSPYLTGTLFSVSVAMPSGCDNVPVYVGSDFWFGNEPAPAKLELDLGDGNGWQQVTMGSTVTVAMGSTGPAVWHILARLPGTATKAGAALARCSPLSVIPDVALGVLASRTWAGYNGQVPSIGPGGIFTPRNWLGPAKAIAWIKYAPSNTSGKLRRPLVFVEGIDFETNNAGGIMTNYQVQATGPIPLNNPAFITFSSFNICPSEVVHLRWTV